jgi:hypothetical protein
MQKSLDRISIEPVELDPRPCGYGPSIPELGRGMEEMVDRIREINVVLSDVSA